MRVLVACEFSGVVCGAFMARGHDAYSCDLLSPLKTHPCPDRHIRGDVEPLLMEKWDLVIAHPPCTYLCNSGVRWLKDMGRHGDMVLGCMFFVKCLKANSDRICVENPIMHHHASRLIRTKSTQIIQPWQFGHPETKSTCLWLRGLSKLQPTKIVGGRFGRVHREPPRAYRSIKRSVTYVGIAESMADQWG